MQTDYRGQIVDGEKLTALWEPYRTAHERMQRIESLLCTEAEPIIIVLKLRAIMEPTE